MSDNEFIIVDEENKETDSGQTGDDVKQEVVSAEEGKEEDKDDDGYEKVCFICHRPESVTGKMIDLPNNITV